MRHPHLAHDSSSILLAALAMLGFGAATHAQFPIRDRYSTERRVAQTVPVIREIGSQRLTPDRTRVPVPYSGTIQAAVGPVLWDQPPAMPGASPIVEWEDTVTPELDLYQVHDVVFTDPVQLTSVCTWYTDNNGTWVGAITQARLNIFTSDPLLASDDPTTGTLVPVTATIDGLFVRIEATLDVALPAGSYWIGLTPIGDILATLGTEYHVESGNFGGQQSHIRNPAGGYGIGADWGTVSVLAGLPAFEGSIRIGGTTRSFCADDCAPRCDQVPDMISGFASDPGIPQSIADNCILTQSTELCELVVWGAYGGAQTLGVDIFTLHIREDAAGQPGTPLYSETGIASTRVATGGIVAGGFPEHRYSLTPATPVLLDPGTYWFEVINDTTLDPDDDWFWETGTLDPFAGIASNAYSQTVPGSSWLPNSFDLAMQVCGKTPGFSDSCPVGCDADVLQEADLRGGYPSDENMATGGLVAAADDFVLDGLTEICEITVRGGYAPANTPLVPDLFKLLIHSDLGGLPGPVQYSTIIVNSVRVPTGLLVGGQLDLYEYVLHPSPPITLPAGVYWLEVVNETTGDADDIWFWATGGIDPDGIAGHAAADQVGGPAWTFHEDDLAMRICGKPGMPCVSYCASVPNATGSAAVMTCSGDPNSSLVLTSNPVPNTTGQFFFGSTMLAGGSSLGDGLRCVGGPTTRIRPFVGAGMMMQAPNTATLALDYAAPYASGLQFTRYFQYWYRSGLSTGSGSNTSNAIGITF